MKTTKKCLLFISFLSLSSAFADEQLGEVIYRINKQIDSNGIEVAKLENQKVLDWFADILPFEFTREQREPLLKGLKSDALIAPYSIELDLKQDLPNTKPEIILKGKNFSFSIIKGKEYTYYSAFARHVCTTNEICKEEYHGEFPQEVATPFPPSIPLKVSEKYASGTCLVPSHCIGDIIEIEIELSKDNLKNVIQYFGQGFDKLKLHIHLLEILGQESKKWVSINSLMQSWVAKKVNTFPALDDNEVCHGPARQFYNQKILNGAYDRSTEATSILLKDFYCPMPFGTEPGFGDYLYIPAMHSGRFILKDPTSKRWIAFSVQSGGVSAYRFWWVDEDFSGHPFAHKPLIDFEKRFVDVWRRCK